MGSIPLSDSQRLELLTSRAYDRWVEDGARISDLMNRNAETLARLEDSPDVPMTSRLILEAQETAKGLLQSFMHWKKLKRKWPRVWANQRAIYQVEGRRGQRATFPTEANPEEDAGLGFFPLIPIIALAVVGTSAVGATVVGKKMADAREREVIRQEKMLELIESGEATPEQLAELEAAGVGAGGGGKSIIEKITGASPLVLAGGALLLAFRHDIAKMIRGRRR
jgi:hypothetical protein